MSRRFFLAFYILTCRFVSVEAQPPMYRFQGEMLHLNPKIIGHPGNILWKHNGNKVVEFDSLQEHVYGHFIDRVTLDWLSAELNITDLTFNDSGVYELEVFTKNLQQFTYQLQVIDKVPKPSISCNLNNGSSNTNETEATLKCHAKPQRFMRYEWDLDGHVYDGSELTIHLDNEQDKIYTCRVSNPLTVETATFNAKTCFPVKSLSSGLAVGLSVTIFLLLLLGVLYFIYKKKWKACLSERNSNTRVRDPKEDAEAGLGDINQPLLNTDASSQQHSHPSQSNGNLEPEPVFIPEEKEREMRLCYNSS